jgi:DeoR/GlpR family transcriptional regulator of sugar metabolism
VGVASFAAAAQLSQVITDRDAPRDQVDQIRAAGADVILV